MDLKDATLMFVIESADQPVVASIAQAAYDRIVRDEAIDYRLLNDLLGEASGKGVLRALRHKYSATTFDAILAPIFEEVRQQEPVGSRWQSSAPHGSADDPLTTPAWPRLPGREGTSLTG